LSQKKEKKTKEDTIDKLWHTGKEAISEAEFAKVKVDWVTRPMDEPKDKLPPLKTNTLLDDLLGGGGLEAGKLAMVYGEYASGKTQIFFTLTVEAEGIVVYIDVEETFSRKRITEIAKARGKDPEEVNKRILLCQPKNWKEQVATLYNLPSPADLDLEGKKISLIIVDSLLALLGSTPDFAGREMLTERQGLLKSYLRRLRKLAKMYKAVAVFSTQVYDKPVATGAYLPDWCSQEPQGGNAVLHIPDFIIFLRKQPTSNIRIARLMDSNEISLGERIFVINERGIDDLPEDEAKKKAIKDLLAKTTDYDIRTGVGMKERKKTEASGSEEKGAEESIDTEDQQ